MRKIKFLAVVVLGLTAASMGSLQAERSPIFGTANIQALSSEAAADITARGAYANYYGSLAIDASYNAYIYSYYARYFAATNSTTEQNWYYTASSYAYSAYIYSYYAYLYSFYRM